MFLNLKSTLFLELKKLIMKNIISLYFLFLFVINVNSQRKIEYIEYDLSNGIHVILHQEKSTPIVAVSVLYHVGSKNEKSEVTGFAHFFEHLLFEGSQNIERGEYDELVEKNGGTLNANTSQDRTFYFEILPSNQLELGLWLESERMLHAKVDIKGIETQRSVVKEEKRQRVDNQPYASFTTEMFKRAFPNHPYNWVPIGSMEHLDAAQESDYVNFYKTFYVPSNATLSIAGDIDIEESKQWIEKYFGSIPKGQAINLYRDYLSHDETTFETKYGVSKDVFDSLMFFQSKDEKAKEIIKKYSAIPTIVKRTEKDKEPINGIIKDVVYDNIQLPGFFMAYAAITNKNISLDDIQEEFDSQIALIKNELISENEFQKIRNSIENDIISSNSSIAGIAENLANNHVYFGGAELINTELDNYLAVTKEDIKRVAKTYFTQNNRIILHYLPKEN